MVSTNVTVRVIDVEWLFKEDKDFLDFALILKSFEKDNLFRTKFVRALTKEFWVPNLKEIIGRLLVPWVFNYLLSLFYFSIVLHVDFHENDVEIKYVLRTVGAITIILSLYQLYIEYKQWKQDKMKYFK